MFSQEVADRKASIYGLYGKDGRLRYIGKANDPAKRRDPKVFASWSRYV